MWSCASRLQLLAFFHALFCNACTRFRGVPCERGSRLWVTLVIRLKAALTLKGAPASEQFIMRLTLRACMHAHAVGLQCPELYQVTHL